jgi:Zn-dependent peptidase ImmA (M78 family)
VVAVDINPAMLAWTMRDAGLGTSDIAALTGRSEDLINKWLTRDAKPSKGDLQRIAQRAGRSIHFFMLANPPAEAASLARFRVAIEGASADPTAERNALRRAHRIQKLAKWAAEEQGESARLLPERTASAGEYADEMRALLEWTRATQRKLRSKSQTFRDVRTRVEALGIVVLLTSMGEGNCRGFSLPDPQAPLIAINADYKGPSLRLFTLLHELAHIAGNDASVCHDENTQEERWCNRFAADFLLPRQDVHRYFALKNWSRVDEDSWAEQIRLTSNYFHASWQAVAIRLRDMRLADQSVVDKVFANVGGEYAGEAGWAPPGTRTRPYVRLEEYGSTYTRAILELRDAARLTDVDARRHLDVNGIELKSLQALLVGAA